MSIFFKSNKMLMVFYAIIAVIFMGISCIGFIDAKYPYYASMITFVGFAFGSLYLFSMLVSATRKINGIESSGKMMAGNLVRFLITAAQLGLGFALIKFLPTISGDPVEKAAYFYLLINLLPMATSILLFYLRGRYVE